MTVVRQRGVSMGSRWGRIGIGLLAAAASAALGLPARAGESYAVFDAVFLQRDNVAIGRSLVLDGIDGPAALQPGDLTFNTQPGMRLFYSEVGDCNPGWEVGPVNGTSVTVFRRMSDS